MKSLSHQFLDFCRSKPADEEYEYTDNRGCAFCQFLRAAGYPVAEVVPHFWCDADGALHRFADEIEAAVIFTDCSVGAINFGRTFGALADRLEQALS